MTVNVTAPFIPPDETTITVTNGKLATKAGGVPITALADGTHGSVMYAESDGTWTQLTPGTDGQVLTTNGAGQDPAWETVAADEGWVFIEKLTPSGAASSTTTGTLPVYNQYMLKVRVTSTGTPVNMRINGSSAASAYVFRYNSGATTWAEGSDTMMHLGGVDVTNCWFIAQVVLEGITRATASGNLPVMVQSAGGSVTQGATNRGYWNVNNNNVQVTSLTIIPNSGAITGTIEVFGRNFHA